MATRTQKVPVFQLYNILLWVGGKDLTNNLRTTSVPKVCTFPEVRVLAAMHGDDRIEANGMAGTINIADQELFEYLGRYVNMKTKRPYAPVVFAGFASGEVDKLPRKAAGAWDFLNVSAETGIVAAQAVDGDDDDVLDAEGLDLDVVDPSVEEDDDELNFAEPEAAPVAAKKTGR